MVELDQFKSILATYTEPISGKVRGFHFDLANKEQRVEELERENGSAGLLG